MTNHNVSFSWKHPVLLLSGIGISNIGAWVYLIALNLIVFNMTGSPLAVAVLYVLIPAASVCSNFWAGSLIDRLNTRRIMVFLNFFRAVCILLLVIMPSLPAIYMLAFAINMAEAVFAPASMVYITKLIPAKDRQRFNALRNFINSSGFLIGPSIAGLLFLIGSPFFAIQINAASLVLSALIILFLPDVDWKKEKDGPHLSWNMIRMDWLEVIRFSKAHAYIAKVYVLFSGVMVFMSAIDSLEAAFAKEVLLLSDSTYGFLVSIAGGGIIAGSIVNTLWAKRLALHALIGAGTVFTAAGYLLYSFSNGFLVAAVGFFLLTFALSFANTGFLTFYQNNVPVEIMGRFGSIFDIIEAVAIIFLTVIFGLVAEIFSIRPVVVAGSFGFLGLGLVICKVVFLRSKQHYYHAEPPIQTVSEKI